VKSLDTCLVLIVDDTETNIDILLATLGEDYEVAVAMDGASALETATAPSGQTSSCSTS
jgi:putative two-component system response regulator